MRAPRSPKGPGGLLPFLELGRVAGSWHDAEMSTADPISVGISSEMIWVVVGWVVTTILAGLFFFMRHSAESERKLLKLDISIVKDLAERTSAEAGKNAAKLRELERVSDQMHGEWKALRSDVDRLDSKDDEQQHYILELKSRLDKGARTFSGQMVSQEPPDPYTPPAMRRRLPSTRGGGE